MFCPKCGTNTDKSSGFCSCCGVRLNPDTAKYSSYGGTFAHRSRTVPADSYKSKAKSKLTGSVIVVITFIVIAVIASAWIILKDDSASVTNVNMDIAQSSPENAVQTFIEAYNNKDSNTIYALTTASTLGDDSVKKEFLEEANQMFKASNETYTMYINVKSVNRTDSETAEVTYDVTVKGLGTTERSEQCKRINGKWYIVTDGFGKRLP